MVQYQTAGERPSRGHRQTPNDKDLAALANFRSALRKFIAFSEQAAAEHGVTLQWYQALLVIKTHQGGPISVGELAEQLMIRDHSAAELVTRLVQAKLVRRRTDPTDRRRSLVLITATGERRLGELAAVHLEKIKETRSMFVDLFGFGGA